MSGLAKDGGLFVPSEIPKLPANFLEKWRDLSFQELAFNIMSYYIGEADVPHSDLKTLIENSYSTFRSEDVTPVRELNSQNNLYLLELFHGPTYAFKDVALQFVGNLFEYFLQRKNANVSDASERSELTVVGATSGDTGSAAIYGLRGKKDVSVFILYPTGRISPIQEDQMTTVEDANVHTLSVKGTFDDCQDIVKQLFGDESFNKDYHVGAVNSINWARILAQMTYYFYSYFAVQRSRGASEETFKPHFVVPSGNFGDILAGYFAKQMGLPIGKLIIATNENDILDRFLKTGVYLKNGDVKSTHSPAMDILISSNFERLLWYLVRDNATNKDDAEAGKILNEWMVQLKTTGSVTAPSQVAEAARADFDSMKVSNNQTVETIKKTYLASPSKYVLDPHSAVGVYVAEQKIAADSQKGTYISLSTAHPAKFSEVVNKALHNTDGYEFERDVLPDELKALSQKEKRITLINEPSLDAVKSAIIAKLK